MHSVSKLFRPAFSGAGFALEEQFSRCPGYSSFGWISAIARRGTKGREIDRRRRLGSGCAGEERSLIESKNASVEHSWKTPDLDIVSLNRLVEVTSSNGDPVLGALDLSLKITEVTVGLQLRIALADGQKPSQRA